LFIVKNSFATSFMPSWGWKRDVNRSTAAEPHVIDHAPLRLQPSAREQDRHQNRKGSGQEDVTDENNDRPTPRLGATLPASSTILSAEARPSGVAPINGVSISGGSSIGPSPSVI
jgi:hypothetical protein